jgi:hypothetical protein
MTADLRAVVEEEDGDGGEDALNGRHHGHDVHGARQGLAVQLAGLELGGEGVGGDDDGGHEGDGHDRDDARALEGGDITEEAEGQRADQHDGDPEHALLHDIIPEGQVRERLLKCVWRYVNNKC